MGLNGVYRRVYPLTIVTTKCKSTMICPSPQTVSTLSGEEPRTGEATADSKDEESRDQGCFFGSRRK